MKIINKKKFAKVAFDKHIKAFIVYITFISIITIHLAKKSLIALLLTKKMQILAKYSDFSDVFLKKKALILPAITKLNQDAIKLQKG